MFSDLFKNKKLYYLTAIIFLLLIFVFDKNNIIEGWKVKTKIRDLKEQKEYYLEKIAADSVVIENLKNDAFLEKFAREKYLMKRQDETIFLIKESN